MSVALSSPTRESASGAEPGGDALADAVSRARAHGLWKRAVDAGDRAGGLKALEGLGGADTQEDWSDLRLVEMRMWQAESLLNAGRPAEADKVLHRLEQKGGKTCRSRFLAARLRLYRNEFEDAARICREAVALNIDSLETPLFEELMHLWANALCLAGAPKRAREVLLHYFGRKPALSNNDLRALRKTITRRDDLDFLCAYLAPLFAGQDNLSRAALYHYSMACRDHGRMDEAITVMRARFLNVIENEKFGGHKKSVGKHDWSGEAAIALRDLKAAMDRAGTPFFLISGTLLGCVRENGILKHDKDIDVGVMDGPDVDHEAVHDALRASGAFLVKPFQDRTLSRLQHANGVLIDLFWHRIEDGMVIHEGSKSKWWNTPFGLEPVQFLNDTYLAPDNTSRYLGENYGDWEKPAPEFETFIDTPNIIITKEREMIWYFYYKMSDYYGKGESVRFRKIMLKLSEICPEDEQIIRVGWRALGLLALPSS